MQKNGKPPKEVVKAGSKGSKKGGMSGTSKKGKAGKPQREAMY